MNDELEVHWSGAAERAGLVPGLSSYQGASCLGPSSAGEEKRVVRRRETRPELVAEITRRLEAGTQTHQEIALSLECSKAYVQQINWKRIGRSA